MIKSPPNDVVKSQKTWRRVVWGCDSVKSQTTFHSGRLGESLYAMPSLIAVIARAHSGFQGYLLGVRLRESVQELTGAGVNGSRSVGSPDRGASGREFSIPSTLTVSARNSSWVSDWPCMIFVRCVFADFTAASDKPFRWGEAAELKWKFTSLTSWRPAGWGCAWRAALRSATVRFSAYILIGKFEKKLLIGEILLSKRNNSTLHTNINKFVLAYLFQKHVYLRLTF